ncbi:MAG: GNAT family N-acetyltransferase [Acidobacteria bacterium]|nr:GNAT family N-acetyltransferase [Acidobacteriota bacterium]
MTAHSGPLTGIRRLERGDLDFVEHQKLREGWALSREQFQVYLEHDPDGCFVAMAGPEPVGMVTTTSFGPSGWIGNLIVEPEFRSRGIGRALMERALESLRDKGAVTVRLEADPPGIPLYRKLGFEDEFESCRLALPASGPGPRPDGPAAEAMRPADLDEVTALDSEIVGPDRRRFLELKLSVAELALVRRRERRVVASLLASPTDRGLRISPCVAREPADARALIATAIAAARGRAVLVGLPARNTEGLEMLAQMGFVPGASSRRMRRGPPVDPGDPTRVFAIASGASG